MWDQRQGLGQAHFPLVWRRCVDGVEASGPYTAVADIGEGFFFSQHQGLCGSSQESFVVVVCLFVCLDMISGNSG